MPETAVDPLPPLKPCETSPRLEVDTFCAECGYNLHSQAVVRDERLGIFVCRCPECGRYHPAGVGMTATRVWLQRLATMLLAFWVLVVLFAFFWILMGLGALPIGHIQAFITTKMISMDGREVEWSATSTGGGAVLKGTTQPVAEWRNIATIDAPKAASWQTYAWWTIFTLVLATVALGFVTGLLLVVFFWHWKKRRYVWTLSIPLAVGAFVATIFMVDEMYEFLHPYVLRIIVTYVVIEMVAMAVGIVIGRPIVRTLLRMVVPARPRQHFAFLWHADGKTLPLARV